MKEELDRIVTGNASDCCNPPKGTALVHACKTCHRKLCGQPLPTAADYLTAEDSGELYLNLIDPKEPLFKIDLFHTALAWMEQRWRDGEKVLIHCDQGNSRSRSLALLLAARLKLIPSTSFIAAAVAFSQTTGQPYRPSLGIQRFIAANWGELMEPPVEKVRVLPKKAGPAVVKTAWKTSNVEKEQQEREEHNGLTLDQIDSIAGDVGMVARAYLKIPDRVTQNPIEYRPSPLQNRMFAWYGLCQERKQPCRMVVPKIRRGGGSTGAQAIMYVHSHNYRARLGAIGTNDTVAMNMFKMVRFFDQHDKFPGWAKASKILETGEMRWPNGSLWETYTAENPESARSAGLQGYHGSEIGRWPSGGAKDAGDTLKSMLGAVPRRGFTVVIEESTAQGAQGAFYERFQSARWPTAEELEVQEGKEYWHKWADETPQNIAALGAEVDLQFVRVFAAWYEDDENRPEKGINALEQRAIEASLDEDEITLIKRFRTIGPQGERLGDTVRKATIWEQLAWRRAVIATEFEGDVEGFKQENPSSPAEAFAAAGRHTFSRAGCAWMSATAKTRTPNPGVLEEQYDGRVTFRRTDDRTEAWFNMWQEPREGMKYLLSLDTMGGRSHTKNLDTADYNFGTGFRHSYLDTQSGEKIPAFVMCSLSGKNQDDPDVLAKKMDLMSRFYGGCPVVHEDNNTGIGYRQEAMRLGTKLYRRQTRDKVTMETTEYVGWITDQKTRPQLFATGKKHIRNNARPETREDGVICWDTVICQQATECILGDDGKDAAPGGKHDDGLMSFLIGLENIGAATLYVGPRRRRQGLPDRNTWRPSGKR